MAPPSDGLPDLGDAVGAGGHPSTVRVSEPTAHAVPHPAADLRIPPAAPVPQNLPGAPAMPPAAPAAQPYGYPQPHGQAQAPAKSSAGTWALVALIVVLALTLGGLLFLLANR